MDRHFGDASSSLFQMPMSNCEIIDLGELKKNSVKVHDCRIHEKQGQAGLKEPQGTNRCVDKTAAATLDPGDSAVGKTGILRSVC